MSTRNQRTFAGTDRLSNQADLATRDGRKVMNAEQLVIQSRRAFAHHQVTLLTAPENELGSAIGKPGRMVAAITDAKLAERVIELSRND